MKPPEQLWPLASSVLLFVALSVLGHLFPAMLADCFVLPGGQLAAWMLGAAPTVWDGGSLDFYAQGLSVRVTEACSGYGFFCILCAWLVYRLWPMRFRLWPVLLSACWLLAVCVNALRVVASVHTRKLGNIFFPDSYQNLIHQGTGMLVFLTFLIVLAVIIHFFHRHVTASTSAGSHPAA